jgi:hypothetical protein
MLDWADASKSNRLAGWRECCWIQLLSCLSIYLGLALTGWLDGWWIYTVGLIRLASDGSFIKALNLYKWLSIHLAVRISYCILYAGWFHRFGDYPPLYYGPYPSLQHSDASDFGRFNSYRIRNLIALITEGTMLVQAQCC